LEQVLQVKKELDLANLQALKIATISLAGSFLENLLLSILHYGYGVQKTSKGKSIFEIELGPLLEEAIGRNIFPSDSVRTSCKVIHVFRNRLHPGNEIKQKYKLTVRVASTLKILLDLTLLEWIRKIP